MAAMLEARHIQDHNEANTTEVKHWAYASRVMPCTSGEGTCEYLDGVYWMHDVSMIYTFILWGVLLGILVLWVALRGWRMGGPAQSMGTVIDKACDGVSRVKRRYLLQDAPMKSVFGRVTRVQLLVLAVLCGYLTVFSFISIVYKTWVTPIKGTNLYNTRVGMGGFSDRIGALAYALTPFAVLLSSRESILSLVTGIPYQHFNFLHRWLGRIMFVQSFVHTLIWTVIEGRLYQPQPEVFRDWIKQLYMVFGCVAMLFITFLTVFSTKRMIRWTGYEFFKITHWIVAILYIGACWGHWDKLYCWMVPSLILIALDQAVRGGRILALHFRPQKGSGLGFKPAQADVKVLGEGDDVVIRMDFDFEHPEPWHAGQHFYLTFPSLSIWQAHPFTPSSSPVVGSKVQHHTYLLRARKGQTALLSAQPTIPVIMTGPYGKPFPNNSTQNVLAVSGGTGVTFTLPITLAALQQYIVPQAVVDFVWVIRRSQDLLWLRSEFSELKAMLQTNPGLRIKVFVTREDKPQVPWCCNTPQQRDIEKPGAGDKGVVVSESSSFSDLSGREAMQELLAVNQPRFGVELLGSRHPCMQEVVDTFMERASINGGCVQIVGSGPDAMGSDIRGAAAKIESKESIDCYWDSRE